MDELHFIELAPSADPAPAAMPTYPRARFGSALDQAAAAPAPPVPPKAGQGIPAYSLSSGAGYAFTWRDVRAALTGAALYAGLQWLTRRR